MRDAQPVLDDQCRISNPSLHDALVTSLSLAQRDCVLGITLAPGRRVELRLVDIEVLRVAEFEEQNVILDVAVFQHPIPAPYMKVLWDVAPDLKWRRAVLDKLDAGELCLVRMSASVGCNFIAACRRVLVTRLSEPSGGAQAGRGP